MVSQRINEKWSTRGSFSAEFDKCSLSSYVSKYKMVTFYVSEKNLVILFQSYWATLDILWNGEKVPNISPLLVSNKPIPSLETKTNILNTNVTS